jgi:hypothetical protein
MVTILDPEPAASSSTRLPTLFLTKKGTLATASSASFVHFIGARTCEDILPRRVSCCFDINQEA